MNWDQREMIACCLKQSTALDQMSGIHPITQGDIIHLTASGYKAARCLKIEAATQALQYCSFIGASIHQ